MPANLSKRKNIFSALPIESLNDEVTEILLENKQVKLERIITTGQTTPKGQWYDQDHDEWVILLKGEASILFEDGDEVHLQSGDYILIKAHQKHRVNWVAPHEVCVWLAVFFSSNSNT